MSSTILLPPRAQLCIRYCSNKHTHATNHKRVLTSAGNRRADLEIRNIRVAQQTDLPVDVTLAVISSAPFTLGRIKASSATPTTRITSSRAPLPTRSATIVTHIAATCMWLLRACMSTSGRFHGELLRLIFFLSNKQADDYFAALGYQPHKQEVCHRGGVFFQQNRGTIGLAGAQAVALRGAPTAARRHVAAPGHPPPLHMAYDDHDRNVSYIHGFT
jgi:hypothetical protein